MKNITVVFMLLCLCACWNSNKPSLANDDEGNEQLQDDNMDENDQVDEDKDSAYEVDMVRIDGETTKAEEQ